MPRGKDFSEIEKKAKEFMEGTFTTYGDPNFTFCLDEWKKEYEKEYGCFLPKHHACVQRMKTTLYNEFERQRSMREKTPLLKRIF